MLPLQWSQDKIMSEYGILQKFSTGALAHAYFPVFSF